MKSNFIKRTITSILFVIILVGCILCSPISFTVLFALISMLSVREFGTLIARSGRAKINKNITGLAAAYLFVAMTAFHTHVAGTGVFLPYVLLLLYLMISELYLKMENPIGNWACSMLSQLYIALPFAMLNVLAFHDDPAMGSTGYHWELPFSIFVFIWLSDVGAYCVGSLIGRHRLFERISPKKSWEGSVGGGLLAVAASLVFAHLFDFMPVVQWIGLSLVVVVFGTWGDLTESLMKRQLGIKDSGNILPGHGGLLDRFDSTLMAVPAAAVYLYLFSL